MTLELYHAHISTCSQKVRLCLAEKGLDFVSHPIDFATRQHLSDDYLALNPNGVVPTLVDGGAPVIDSSVICEYLDEAYPDEGARLLPADPLGRARVRAWLRYIEEVPTSAIRMPSFNSLFKGFLIGIGQEGREAYIARTPLRKDLYRKFGDSGFSDEDVESAGARLRACLERMQTSLSGSAWLAGDTLTLADICVLPTLVRMEDIGMANMWEDLGAVADWYARITTRPSFGTAYYDGARVAVGGNVLKPEPREA